MLGYLAGVGRNARRSNYAQRPRRAALPPDVRKVYDLPKAVL